MLAGYALAAIVAATLSWLSPAPPVAAAGLHPVEQDGVRSFRWTSSSTAAIREPVAGAVVTITIRSGPEEVLSESPVMLSLAGVGVARLAGAKPHWTSYRYYVPPLLGPEKWSRVGDEWRRLARITPADDDTSAWYSRFLPIGDSEFRSQLLPSLWRDALGASRHAHSNFTTLELRISAPLWVPADHVDSTDHRQLGVALAPLSWTREMPPGGIGFHDWETDPEIGRFRWTGQRASISLRPRGTRAHMLVRAAHPDAAEIPVEVQWFRDSLLVATTSIDNGSWQEVVLPGWQPGDPEVLTIAVDRTWNPTTRDHLTPSTPSDDRDLGLAVTVPRWNRP